MEGLNNMKEMEERELQLDEFAALNHIIRNGGQVDMIDANHPVLNMSKYLNHILKVKLPADAIAYIKDIKEEDAEPEVIELLVKADDGSYSATEYAKLYVEYYHNCIITRE